MQCGWDVVQRMLAHSTSLFCQATLMTLAGTRFCSWVESKNQKGKAIMLQKVIASKAYQHYC